MVAFEGPLARDVLERLGASGSRIRAIAINDYVVEIPVSDLLEHRVILAMRRDGKPMSVRDKGPLWIIYPWSDEPALKTEIHHSRSIWQLKQLVVE